ncbi:PKD domain-containing protein [candidate division KSB1 bacterium]|nr:PKD domain-containing protein [candidate division KSB1 bacterium]
MKQIMVFLTMSHAVFAVDIKDIEVFPEKILDTSGYSADVYVHPLDGSIHFIWVSDGDLKYVVRSPQGEWNDAEICPDAGEEIFGTDEGGWPRHCASLTIDTDGNSHIVFTTRSNRVYYLHGSPGAWNTPLVVADQSPAIMPGIVKSGNRLFIVWEDGEADNINLLIFQNGAWGNPIIMARGEYPSLATGPEGTVYFLTRSRTLIRNAIFAYLLPGSTSWKYIDGATDAPDRLGSGPKLTVANGKLYMGWSNSIGIDGPNKSQLYCAVADEPGNKWTTRLDNEMVISESTGDPHPRVEIFHDGSLLFLNGNRRGRLRIHDGSQWSTSRIVAPWDGVIPECAREGRTIWVVLSSVIGMNKKVSAYGIRAPEPDAVDQLSVNAKILSSGGFGGQAVMDPLDGSIHCAWFQDDGIWYTRRNSNGIWQSTEKIFHQDVRLSVRHSNIMHSLGLDINREGRLAIICTNGIGGLSWISGQTGDWSGALPIPGIKNAVSPVVIMQKTAMIAVWSDTTTGTIKTIEYKNNWGQPNTVAEGSSPRLSKGQSGLVYLTYRSNDDRKNFALTSKIPLYTPWSPPLLLTDAEHTSGQTAGLFVENGRIYLAWSNNTDQRGDWQSQLFCASADEPGDNLQSRTGSRYDQTGIIFMNEAADPQPAVGIYNNGDLLLLNGQTAPNSISLGDGTNWTKARGAPWINGVPHTMSDGRCVWIFVSPKFTEPGQVTMTAVEHPTALKKDFENGWPLIVSTPDTFAVLGANWTYDCRASDENNDPLTYSLLHYPQGMTINPSTGAVLWIPDESAMVDIWQQGNGVHLVGIEVRDNRNGHDEQFFWLRVSDQQNRPPYFNSIPITSCFADSLYQYQSSAADPDDDPLVYSLQQSPAGMTVDAGSGLVSWLPGRDQVGTHPVVLSVQDTNEETARQEYILTVLQPIVSSPAAEFSAEPTNGPVPLTVEFKDHSTGEVNSHLWQFGDGQTSVEVSPVHVYTTAGEYTVTLQVTGPGGTDQEIKPGYIHVYVYDPQPVAEFGAFPAIGPAPLAVQFSDSSTGNITSWSWTFGDDSQSTEKAPFHVYTTTGEYDVTLTVAGPGGEDSKTRTKYIVVTEPAPIAGFFASPRQGMMPLTVQFTDTSIGEITSRRWNFGDGEFSEALHPLHTFTNSGRFDVSLEISGPGGTDQIVKPGYIQVFENPTPHAAFSAVPKSGEWPLRVQFSDSSTGDITTWFWDFGDSAASLLQNPLHIYKKTGRYAVRLTVRGPGGGDSVEKKDYIVVTDPILQAGFTAQPLSGVMPLSVQFTDTSRGPAENWLWRFGDGEASYEKNPMHIFKDHGLFSITLVVESYAGIDSLTKKDYIHVTPAIPEAYFSAEPLIGHVPLTVQFQDSSKGLIEFWQWDFGDSTKSNVQNPGHTYILPGLYSIRLTVSGPGGKDTFIRPGYIRVDLPSGAGRHSARPTVFLLEQNYPNPFNGVTTIQYQLAEPTALSLEIFDISGKKIKTLFSGIQETGTHKTEWDVTTDNGESAASGIYLIRMTFGTRTIIKKMVFTK